MNFSTLAITRSRPVSTPETRLLQLAVRIAVYSGLDEYKSLELAREKLCSERPNLTRALKEDPSLIIEQALAIARQSFAAEDEQRLDAACALVLATLNT